MALLRIDTEEVARKLTAQLPAAFLEEESHHPKPGPSERIFPKASQLGRRRPSENDD